VALSLEELEKGMLIDSSYIRKEPLSFTIGSGEVLRGIDEGVRTMKVGDLRRLIIPPQLAFGQRGVKGLIPPNSTLYVDLKLRYIEP